MKCDIMTPKERWQAVLQREIPDRIPMDYWGTQETTHKLMTYLEVEDYWQMCERLHIDAVFSVQPAYVGPIPREGYDSYGRGYQNVDYGIGIYQEVVDYPLARFQDISELESDYVWPTADWFDYSVIPNQLIGREQYPVRGGGSEPFYEYTLLRGQELAYLDIVNNPEFLHYCLDRLVAFNYENTRRVIEQIPGKMTFTYISEDLGSQVNLLFSPANIHKFFIPGMRRMIELAREAGVYVFTHSDGAIRKIIPDLIEIGIDILNPIQWRCAGMEREGLKQDFGESLIFHGGMDNQYTLPFGTVEQVRKEVMENLEILGKGGGYILAPCHNIQANTPPENIVALYETGYEYSSLDS
jgi:uroporphyrinogen decarboxylase